MKNFLLGGDLSNRYGVLIENAEEFLQDLVSHPVKEGGDDLLALIRFRDKEICVNWNGSAFERERKP